VPREELLESESIVRLDCLGPGDWVKNFAWCGRLAATMGLFAYVCFRVRLIPSFSYL
jgi:hypothetical protein